MQYVFPNHLLSTKQFGFIEGRSSLIRLIKLLDKWTFYLDNYDGVDVIYTDYEKAFDKVPHNRLLFKLKKYDICDVTVNRIESYLNNRKRRES